MARLQVLSRKGNRKFEMMDVEYHDVTTGCPSITYWHFSKNDIINYGQILITYDLFVAGVSFEATYLLQSQLVQTTQCEWGTG